MTDASAQAGHPAGRHRALTGFFQAVIAYSMWGLLPLFFHLFGAVSPFEIVGHRIIWSTLLLLAVLAGMRQLAALGVLLRTRRLLAPLAGSAVMIAVNWLTYIWAVANHHIVAASLGYFLNPLVNVLLGYAVLHERLTKIQGLAVVIAGAGVAYLAIDALDTLWISLTLAFSFGLYGLIRKTAETGPLLGLAAETILLAPLAMAFLLVWQVEGRASFMAAGAKDSLLLMSTGVVTAVPLLLFVAAARKLRYTTIGLIQYIAPSLQLALGLWLYHEPVQQAHYVAFPLIWGALLLYSVEFLRLARRLRPSS